MKGRKDGQMGKGGKRHRKRNKRRGNLGRNANERVRGKEEKN